MRIFTAVLVLIFSIQSWARADDIRDFEIEGMSIGDSLLDYFSENEIKYDKKKYNYPNSNTFTLWVSTNKPYDTYEGVQFHFKTNDPKYIIHAIDGHIYYFDNIEECYPKKKEIYNELKKVFPNTKASSHKVKHQLDNKTMVDQTIFELNQGYLMLECYDWNKKMEQKYGDKLSLSISTTEFMDWIDNEAF